MGLNNILLINNLSAWCYAICSIATIGHLPWAKLPEDTPESDRPECGHLENGSTACSACIIYEGFRGE